MALILDSYHAESDTAGFVGHSGWPTQTFLATAVAARSNRRCISTSPKKSPRCGAALLGCRKQSSAGPNRSSSGQGRPAKSILYLWTSFTGRELLWYLNLGRRHGTSTVVWYARKLTLVLHRLQRSKGVHMFRDIGRQKVHRCATSTVVESVLRYSWNAWPLLTASSSGERRRRLLYTSVLRTQRSLLSWTHRFRGHWPCTAAWLSSSSTQV